MDGLIKFRSNINLLSDSEFYEFIKQYGKKNIINLLFKHHHQSIQLPSKQTNQIQNINDIITTIIRSRKKKKTSTIYNTNVNIKQTIKLDQLPTALISHISSFLHFKHILNFEKCNRSVFIGVRYKLLNKLNSDCILKYLSFCIKNKSVNYDLNRFQLSYLEININDGNPDWIKFKNITNFKFNHLSIWNNLTHLILRIDVIESSFVGKYIFAELSQCNLSNITSLSYSGEIKDLLDCKLLSKLTKLRYFQFCTYDGYDPISFEDSARLSLQLTNLSDLKGLQITTDLPSDLSLILKNISHKLESFHFGTCDEPGFNGLRNSNFVNLKEICLNSPVNDDIENILRNQSLRYLERICLDVGLYNYYEISDTHKQNIESLFSLKTLNSISIELCSDGDNTTGAMMIYLLQNALKNNKYNQMRITFNCYNNAGDKSIDAIIELIRILKYQCLDFILICDFEINKDYKGNDKLNKLLSDNNDEFIIKYSRTPAEHPYAFRIHHSFVIKNKKCKLCKIDGDSWIMSCFSDII